MNFSATSSDAFTCSATMAFFDIYASIQGAPTITCCRYMKPSSSNHIPIRCTPDSWRYFSQSQRCIYIMEANQITRNHFLIAACPAALHSDAAPPKAGSSAAPKADTNTYSAAYAQVSPREGMRKCLMVFKGIAPTVVPSMNSTFFLKVARAQTGSCINIEIYTRAVILL